MTVKITGSTGVTRSQKTKKANTQKADGTKFTSMLDAIMQTQAPDAPQSVEEREAGVSYVPQDPKERSAWMLEKLEKLYADVLSGNPTLAAAELQEALKIAVTDRKSLPPHLQELLKELDLRSAVEIAKLEAAKTNS